MKSCIVVCPNVSKESAEVLANLLKADYDFQETQDTLDYTDYDVVINYGKTSPILYKTTIINPTEAVKICKNKISTLKRVKDYCNIVPYTKLKEQALEWVKNDGIVVAREFQESTQGKGLRLCYSVEDVQNTSAKYWSRYCVHTHEVRINVFKDSIVSIYDKVENNGFFDFIPLEIAGEHPHITSMIKAIKENIGIDLYGMDVLVDRHNVCRLLEVNSGAIIHPATEKPLKKLLKEMLK